jgi:hypothetical protein
MNQHSRLPPSYANTLNRHAAGSYNGSRSLSGPTNTSGNRHIFADYGKAMSSIDKARGDPRIQTTLDDIKAKVKLKFQKSSIDEWSSNLEEGRATIGYNSCRHPSAALAHELLHIDTQLRGYRRMRIALSSIDHTHSFKRLMDCLDNELQHHTFCPKFLKMGFAPGQFYCDSE